MPREERRRIHLLAEFYGLKSVSYDNDPRRFVALIKAPGEFHVFLLLVVCVCAH